MIKKILVNVFVIGSVSAALVTATITATNSVINIVESR